MEENRRSSDLPAWLGEHKTRAWEELDRYDRASPAVDCVLLTVEDKKLFVLVSRRHNEPDKGAWSLPGVFVNPGATYEEEVKRALEVKAGLDTAQTSVHLEQLTSWNQPDRDPRGWVITVAYLALASASKIRRQIEATSDHARLVPVRVSWLGDGGGPVELELPDGQQALALQHDELVAESVKRLRGKVRYAPLLLNLVDERFTLRELQETFEAVNGEPSNKATFRKLIEDRGWVRPTRDRQSGDVAHRPARLYRRT